MAPENLRWKVWMSGSRLEAHLGDLGKSEALVLQCVNDIPDKQLGLGYLELSKFWELKGDFEKAESLMLLAMQKIQDDWKLYFEGVLMFMRNGQMDKAENLVKESLKVHNVTGRLWATLIQIKHARVT